MRSPQMKWAAAAALVVAVGTGFVGLWHSGSTAYAFAQTVEAMQGKRSFHIQTYFQQRRHDEFWAEFDRQGNLLRFRQEEDGGPKGPLITIWDNGILNRYYPEPGLHQYSRLPNTEHGIEGLEEFDPETIVQEINTLVETGQAVMETDPLSRYAKLVTLRVSQERIRLKRVLVVDPVTKFVVRVDDYWGYGKDGAIHKGIEVLEYNEAMDPRLFEPDFPPDTLLMDQVTQQVGIAQGDMTVKEAAVEVVRQALEAWTQEDYARAGRLFGGVPPQWFTEIEKWQPVRIISIGPAEPAREDDRPPYQVRCQCETERNGQTRTVTLALHVPGVYGQPGRWYVSPFWDKVQANEGRLDITKANLGLVQGQLSDEEVATEVVRQYFEALQAGDYDAAGKLVPPDGDVDMEECLGTAEFLRLASIEEALLIPSRGDKVVGVVCTIECEEDGRKNLKRLRATIVQRSDRWVFQDLSN